MYVVLLTYFCLSILKYYDTILIYPICLTCTSLSKTFIVLIVVILTLYYYYLEYNIKVKTNVFNSRVASVLS